MEASLPAPDDSPSGYFQVRDHLDQRAEPLECGTRMQVLDNLLTHVMYRGLAYGWVTDDHATLGYLSRRLGLNEKTVRRSLDDLEAQDLIQRSYRPDGKPGKGNPKRIYVPWLAGLTARDTESSSDTESSCNRTESPVQGTESPVPCAHGSSLEELKEPLQERAQARDRRKDRKDPGKLDQSPAEAAQDRSPGLNPPSLVEYTLRPNGSDKRTLILAQGPPGESGGESRWYPESMAAEIGKRHILHLGHLNRMIRQHGWTVGQSKINPSPQAVPEVRQSPARTSAGTR